VSQWRNYYTLLASLPALPPRFDVDRCPITWPRLEHRLRMLEPDDAETLQRLIDFFAWDRQPLGRTDDEVVARHKALCEIIRHPVVRKIIEDRIDIRTILSGLRRRKLGLVPPPGVGRWTDTIRRRWNVPQFGLQTRYPWISDLEQMLAHSAVDEAEKLILWVNWKNWSRAASNYHFSFEAVLYYVSRWAIVNRWTSRNFEQGRERFAATVSRLVEEYVEFDS
jgi:hypothetical protein